MDVDHILRTFNAHRVDYLLIGGMNFLLFHEPALTFDVDLWIDDVPDNLRRAEEALGELRAEWGATERDWRPVAEMGSGWLSRQSVFCLTSPHGSIDVFRAVRGLESWAASRGGARSGKTPAGIPFLGLSDQDMLKCQLALPERDRRLDRIRSLQQTLQRMPLDEPDRG